MKILKKISVIIISAILLGFSVVTAFAAPLEHDGLEFSMVTDKENYELGETINAVITVKNTNTEPVTIVDLEQIVPEGYKIKEDAETQLTNIELAPGETITLNVTFEDATEPSAEEMAENFFDTVIYGETVGIPNILIAFLLIVGIIIFFKLT